MQKCNSKPISLHRVLSTLRPPGVNQYSADGLWQVATLITGCKWCSLSMAGDDEMFMTRCFNITPKTTEQHLIVCSDKSVAYVTNNKTCLDILYYRS